MDYTQRNPRRRLRLGTRSLSLAGMLWISFQPLGMAQSLTRSPSARLAQSARTASITLPVTSPRPGSSLGRPPTTTNPPRLSQTVPRVPVPPVAPTLPPAFTTDNDYLLGPGDRVRVDFFNVPELSGEFQVLPNGSINLPQIGPVTVRGRTLEQASQLITTQARRVLRFPVVTVSLLVARPIAIAVAGEVNRPGTYTLPGLATDGAVPILSRLLRLADGVTQSADLSQVIIRRPSAPGSTTGQIITADLRQLLRTGDINQDIRLRDGDSIFIPAAKEIRPNEAWDLANANFATLPDRPVRVTVVGQVNRPGPYTIIGDRVTNVVSIVGTTGAEAPQVQVPTISRAIQAAGGIVAHAADVRNIKLRRIPRTGDIQEINIDLWKLLKTGDIRQDIPLQDGDSIEIPTARVSDEEARDLGLASYAPGSITVNIVGEVVRPGPVQLAPNSPVLQGLLAAGGFNNRAKRGEITLVRLNDNGSVSRQDVKVNYGQGISSATNPPLRNGDTVIVARSGISSFTEGISTVLSPLSGVLNFLRLFGVPTPTPPTP